VRLSFTLLLVLSATVCRAEWVISGYIGGAQTQNASIAFNEPGRNTSLRLSGVQWEGRSFEGPLYYGVRGGRFFHRYVGFETEFIHLKVFALVDRTVQASGVVRGAPVGGTVPMNTYVQRFSISHGNNLLLGNVVGRYDLWRAGNERLGRVLLTMRVGFGGSIPHPETQFLGSFREHYQGGGFAYQIAGGGEFRLWRGLYALGEYKYTNNREQIVTGTGTADTRLRSHHGVTGLAIHF